MSRTCSSGRFVNTLRSQDPEKLKAREQRFGTRKSEQQTGAVPAPTAGGGKKRRSAVEEVDAEEQERRRKRAERFGIPLVVSQSIGCFCRCSHFLGTGCEGLMLISTRVLSYFLCFFHVYSTPVMIGSVESAPMSYRWCVPCYQSQGRLFDPK